MFLKSTDKKDKSTGKVYRYYKLCSSYRIGNSTRHHDILTLGKLEELDNKQDRKLLADRIEQILRGTQTLFDIGIAPVIEELAQRYSGIIKQKELHSYPIKSEEIAETAEQINKEVDFQLVDVNTMKLEDTREVGSEWLCKQAIDELGLKKHLQHIGMSNKEIGHALIHIISKAVFPASETRTAKWLQQNSSLCELFGLDYGNINRFHLYKASSNLYKHKELIESYLSKKTNELFDIDDKILLFDLTNTYFEGRKQESHLGRFGKSKEKRSDCKLVALALVVNSSGFVKYSHIYRGNISDCETLLEIVDVLVKQCSCSYQAATIVIDAGISTEENLAGLRQRGYKYVCVSRSKLKDYEFTSDKIVHLTDKRKHPIEARWVKRVADEQPNDIDNPNRKKTKKEKEIEADTDSYLYIKSLLKQLKEKSMNNHFCEHYEQALETIAKAIHKPNGTKQVAKVWQRIGRVQERYSYANKHYDIEVKANDNGIAIEVNWKRKAIKPKTAATEGVYFIRTNIEDTNEQSVWNIYNLIREIEHTFRILKSDLRLRPVHHQKDEMTEAHLFLAILAYTVVHTIRFRLKNQNIHHNWDTIVMAMNTQKVGTVSVENDKKQLIYQRLCSKPNQEVKLIYDAMRYKYKPFKRRKFVFPEK